MFVYNEVRDLKKINKPLNAFKLICFCLVAIFIFLITNSLYNTNVKNVLCGYSVRKIPIYSVDRDDKLIAISFDCAWGNEYTDNLLEEMERYKVHCTFFAVSFWVEKYPDCVKKIVENGHEIGTHSKTHSYMSKQSAEEIDAELEYSCSAIEKITGKKVELFRAPYGDYDNLLIERAEAHGLYTIQWDVDSLDWKGLSASEICARVTSRVKNGSIILMHNNSDNILDALRLTLTKLKNQGYKITCISDLIYKEGFVVDRNGIQHKN